MTQIARIVPLLFVHGRILAALRAVTRFDDQFAGIGRNGGDKHRCQQGDQAKTCTQFFHIDFLPDGALSKTLTPILQQSILSAKPQQMCGKHSFRLRYDTPTLTKTR
jgi:hypothetical protein